ncbi:MAG: hypothetical protein HY868_25720 [Chloroflexi bacterium]|nr:hypothetical protein [Chloroflexota bacterium]
MKPTNLAGFAQAPGRSEPPLNNVTKVNDDFAILWYGCPQNKTFGAKMREQFDPKALNCLSDA